MSIYRDIMLLEARGLYVGWSSDEGKECDRKITELKQSPEYNPDLKVDLDDLHKRANRNVNKPSVTIFGETMDQLQNFG